jgi:glucose-6-phosphate 1-dehydrogenase
VSATRIEALAPPAAAARPRPAPPCALVVFGGSGDLARRKLVPALYDLMAAGRLSERFALLGVARRPMSGQEFREEMEEAARRHSRLGLDAEVWRRFAPRLDYLSGEFAEPPTYDRLSVRLQQLDDRLGLEGNRLLYLATPPREFGVVLGRLAEERMIGPPRQEPWTRVIVEKPFGRDLASARALDAQVASLLDESQVFRIDHYLGKETVQNILVLRFANAVFEPFWNRKHVDHVQICVAETAGVEPRGPFYDQTGVLRDVVQNHMLELLALTAMEAPVTALADDIRGEKLKVLRALRATVSRDVVLGQYRGYREERGVAPDSVTPTFAALRVFVDNWRWQGVPFYLRTGKKLQKHLTEIAIHMQPVPLCLFGQPEACRGIEPNVLGLRIQPDEGVHLEFASKIPGDALQVGTVKMDMRYVDTFGGEPPEAYERLLLDAMRGDATLFSHRDWVEAAWAWLDPVLRHHERGAPADFPNYEPGSWGPEACVEWMRRERRAWREL